MNDPGRGIAGHNGQPPPVQQVAVSKVVTFQNVNVNVEASPDGGRVVQIIDAMGGTIYSLPLNGETAREFGAALMSSIAIAGADEVPSEKS